jgi:hypothetical protein
VSSDCAERRTRRSVSIVSLVLLGGTALLVYRPGPLHELRNWGVHFATYLPVGVQIAYGALALLLALAPRARELLLAGVAAGGRALGGAGDGRLRRRTSALLVAIGFVLLCWLLRSRYAFLGDNQLRLEQVTQGRILPYEWGTMLLAHRAVELGRAAFQWEPRLSLALFNTLAGFPFAFAAIGIARTLGRTARARGTILLGLFSLGAVELFCGYVETYAWAMALLVAYVAALLRALRGGSWARPALLLLLAVAMHAIALLFALPLLLRLRRGRDGAPGWALVDVGPTAVRAAAALLILAAAAAPWVAPRLFHAYASSRAGDLTLLSPALGWERLNGLLLASVAGTLIGIPLLAIVFAKPRSLGTQQLQLATLTLPVLVALVPMKLVLGAADWDILAFAGLPLLVGAAAALAADLRGERGPARPAPTRSDRWAFVPLLLCLSLANTWGFVAVQHGEASVRRIRDIVTDDPAPYFRSHPPPVHLSMLYGQNGLMEHSRDVLLQGMEAYPDDPRLPHNLAAVCFSEQRWVEAKHWALRALERHPGYVPSMWLLYLIAQRQGDRAAQLQRGGAILELCARDAAAIERYVTPDELEALRENVAGPGTGHP